MNAPVNATQNSRITSKNFMYGYKLPQIHRCKMKISVYAHTQIHVQLFIEFTHTTHTATQCASIYKICHTDNVHTWSYLKTASAF